MLPKLRRCPCGPQQRLNLLLCLSKLFSAKVMKQNPYLGTPPQCQAASKQPTRHAVTICFEGQRTVKHHRSDLQICFPHHSGLVY